MTAPNLVVSISGLPKSGKTHLALTFPDPIKVFSLDHRAKKIRDKFPSKKIDIQEYDLPIADSLSAKDVGFKSVWDNIRDDLHETFASGEYKTVVIDLNSILWEIIRYAFNEQQDREIGSGGKARNYGEPNARMYGIIMRAQVSGVNIVLLNYLKEQWLDDKNTGKLVLDGWRRTEGQVDVVLEIRADTQLVSGKKKNVNITKVKANGYDRELDGLELTDATYNDLLVLLGVG